MEYSIFDGLSEVEVKKIKKLFKNIDYKKKETIYVQQSLGSNMFKEESSELGVYFIEKGIIKISIKNKNKNHTIAFLKKGDFFGEMSSLLGFISNANVVALEDTNISFLSSVHFNTLLGEMPKLGIALSKYLAKRTQYLSGTIFDHVFKSLEARTAANILSVLDEFGEEKNGKYYLKIKITHQDFADFIGTNRETVTKILNIFKKKGIIDFIDRILFVNDLEKLKEIYKNG